MSPALSTARLPIQRKSVVSGRKICCWTMGVWTVAPVTSIWPHCGEVFDPETRVVWLTQIDSAPPMLRYCTRCIRRLPRLSSVFELVAGGGCGTMLLPTLLYVACATAVAALMLPPPLQAPAVSVLTLNAFEVLDSVTKYS